MPQPQQDRSLSLSLKVRFSAKAQKELIDIYSYSIAEWGESRADLYIDQIRVVVELIASMPKIGRPYRGLRLSGRKHNVGSHVIIYKAGRIALSILRIVHKRMLDT